jgi:bacteriocin biosynthesis cyclodehydratase domain-containing protein
VNANTPNLYRPRLLPGLPVLHRRAGETQIGLDPRHAVVISGLSDAATAVLRELDGRFTRDELLDRGDHTELVLLLDQLSEAGLLEDAAEPVPGGDRIGADTTCWALRTGIQPGRLAETRRQAGILVHGDGRLATAVGALLAAGGVGRVHVAANGTVRGEDTGCGYAESDVGTARQDAASAALLRGASTADTSAPGRRQRPDLAILADASVPDPDVVARLFADGVPHLLLRVREGVGWIGPLVLPGRTSCLRCLDLHRTDRDEHWPVVAAQLAGRRQPADLACAQATAALAAAQVFCVLHEGSAQLWNAAVLVDPCSTRTWRREWSPHPDCTCGAANFTSSVLLPSSGCEVDGTAARMSG